MKICGIVAEFNPFHSGHKHLLDTVGSKDFDAVISAMSGNFTQRGEPAVSDKWQRAEDAVKQGVDLVLEIPAVYTLGSAESFAKAGVSILETMGSAEIAFGSESADVEKLSRIAGILKSKEKEIHSETRKLLKEGVSFPKARQLAVSGISPDIDASVMSNPNDILAIEYLVNMKSSVPLVVARNDEGHEERASSIREEMKKADPEGFRDREKRYFDLLRYRVLSEEPEYLESLYSAGEGLGNKILKEIRYAADISDLLERTKSKAYTRTRISRLLAQTVLGISDKYYCKPVYYARVLAFSGKGAELLREAKGFVPEEFPIITNINRERPQGALFGEMLDKDILAQDIFNIVNGRDMYENSDFVKMPYKA